MPYIDTWAWFETKLKPINGEDYNTYMARCVPALRALEPEMTEECAKQMCDSGWSDYILRMATEATITIKREFHTYQDSVYMDGWFEDWKVTDILSAALPQMSITYSAVEKARAGTGKAFNIAKSKEEEQLVFGWANISKEADGSFPLDWDGDVTLPEHLEKAAYNFVLKHRVTGEQHQGEAVGNLVESVMFTKEKQQALGIPEGIMPEGWWVGFHIPDAEVFAKIKSGEYEMFSVQGSAIRVPTGQ